MLKCEEAEIDLSAYLDGELSSTDRARLESHLVLCERCNAILTELETARSAMTSLERHKVPAAFLPALKARIAAAPLSDSIPSAEAHSLRSIAASPRSAPGIAAAQIVALPIARRSNFSITGIAASCAAMLVLGLMLYSVTADSNSHPLTPPSKSALATTSDRLSAGDAALERELKEEKGRVAVAPTILRRGTKRQSQDAERHDAQLAQRAPDRSSIGRQAQPKQLDAAADGASVTEARKQVQQDKRAERAFALRGASAGGAGQPTPERNEAVDDKIHVALVENAPPAPPDSFAFREKPVPLPADKPLSDQLARNADATKSVAYAIQPNTPEVSARTVREELNKSLYDPAALKETERTLYALNSDEGLKRTRAIELSDKADPASPLQSSNGALAGKGKTASPSDSIQNLAVVTTAAASTPAAPAVIPPGAPASAALKPGATDKNSVEAGTFAKEKSGLASQKAIEALDLPTADRVAAVEDKDVSTGTRRREMAEASKKKAFLPSEAKANTGPSLVVLRTHDVVFTAQMVQDLVGKYAVATDDAAKHSRGASQVFTLAVPQRERSSMLVSLYALQEAARAAPAPAAANPPPVTKAPATVNQPVPLPTDLRAKLEAESISRAGADKYTDLKEDTATIRVEIFRSE